MWANLYKEIAERITNNLTEIRYVDLWHEQVSYLTEELPFPTPAVFIAIRTLNIDDRGLLIQECDTQVDFYLFYETFSDTYAGAYNQDSALDFLDSLSNTHKLFHGTSGTNYSEMRRVGISVEDSGGSGNLYRISFQCVVSDDSAQPIYGSGVISDISVEDKKSSPPNDDEPLFSL